MSPLLLAGLAGLLSGLSLVVGSLVAWFVKVPREVVALVMAFGAGVLISALSFDLVDEAAGSGGVVPTLGGFVAGAVVYVVLDQILEHGGFRRKHHGRSGGGGGTGVGIALGALLDGVPETAVQGLSLTGGGALSIGVLVAVVISNFPEGMSSTAGLKQSGRSARYVFGLWTSIAVVCALSALGGYALLGGLPESGQSVVMAFAAGAILAMICDTMIPEAFRRAQALTGLVTVLGFVASYAVHQAG
ncbi:MULTISPECIES: ZIP family metal transporter [Clavibacter]|uniref:ZIP family zinc transporter n=2 Tax=Clavibacter TaxID=1573 RepID=A0A399NPM2_9MICO|nr:MULTISPECIES: ZIP family zinc transporter [Clavibacter]KDP92014.1 ZIP family zinc transporter [Clavibacter cf. michiganensis LMG 26808]RII96103.1 ZIP family zinc transporter [Clavibacter michiganensis]UKF24983.1 ZIP family zinc transporter [Clavibacter sp. A6099]